MGKARWAVSPFLGGIGGQVNVWVDTKWGMISVTTLQGMGVHSVFDTVGGHPLNSYTPMHPGAMDMWLLHGGQAHGKNCCLGPMGTAIIGQSRTVVLRTGMGARVLSTPWLLVSVSGASSGCFHRWPRPRQRSYMYLHSTRQGGWPMCYYQPFPFLIMVVLRNRVPLPGHRQTLKVTLFHSVPHLPTPFVKYVSPSFLLASLLFFTLTLCGFSTVLPFLSPLR